MTTSSARTRCCARSISPVASARPIVLMSRTRSRSFRVWSKPTGPCNRTLTPADSSGNERIERSRGRHAGGAVGPGGRSERRSEGNERIGGGRGGGGGGGRGGRERGGEG